VINRVELLLQVLQSHAPDEATAARCQKIVSQAQAYSATEDDIERILVDALTDGLRHGNWPWS
jgi:hypothetical protein